MGAAWMSRRAVISTLSEIVGYKSGLALNRAQILGHLARQGNRFYGRDDDGLRIRSEEFEEMVSQLLYRVGVVDSPVNMPPGIALFHQYKKDAKALDLSNKVQQLFMDMFDQLMQSAEQSGTKRIDPEPYLDEAMRLYGPAGCLMSIEFIKLLAESQEHSPWGKIRQVDWKDTRELDDLFKSEHLATQYGEFFDQRFVTYLERNFNDIDQVHWRQFEGLTAEFFDRLGFHVEVGPGRKDGGVDIRIWPTTGQQDKPPTVLIQCKRQKATVEQVVVKALYADVSHESASAGLIVTTSRLAKGAVAVNSARSYPIGEANRKTLKVWVEAMRTPGSGVFLGE
ncbi:MAG: restriction endonuclease [Fimbriimonas sp.]|nr:restriction endonuclease [Fimbriimonas sp.]